MRLIELSRHISRLYGPCTVRHSIKMTKEGMELNKYGCFLLKTMKWKYGASPSELIKALQATVKKAV